MSVMQPSAEHVNGSGEATRWITPGHACEMLGVDESTIRRWADTGEIRCFRTPGGHRRFAEADLLALTGGHAEGELEAEAVTRVRRQLGAGQRDAAWSLEVGDDAREALRPLGHRLVALVDDYLSRRGRLCDTQEEIDRIGEEYGRELYRRGLRLLRAVEAFTFFRHSLDETTRRLADRSLMTPDETARAREEVAALADRVLIGLATVYDAHRKHRQNHQQNGARA